MCGVFGAFDQAGVSKQVVSKLARHAEQRGIDSSGVLFLRNDAYEVLRAEGKVTSLLSHARIGKTKLIMGHSRLATNGESDNQPVLKPSVAVIHNGIVVNHEKIWQDLQGSRELQVDTEVIAQIAEDYVQQNGTLKGVSLEIFRLCQGAVSCAVISPLHGELVLMSNTGSMYVTETQSGFRFASEAYPLRRLGDPMPRNIINSEVVLTIPSSPKPTKFAMRGHSSRNLLPTVNFRSSESDLLVRESPALDRCSKCILPSTMPFISFDKNGICNYCLNYQSRQRPKSLDELQSIVEKYRRTNGPEAIIPFSGGRDSSFGLHLVVRELGIRPVTFTYDWGMLTDLGRRNASLMSAKLGVENIIVAADIGKKRKNIARNLRAWLSKPHLGMVSILTAGDKHFFKYVDTVKEQTGVRLNLWGINPLEVTHFKSGFLGVAPDFGETRVYTNGPFKQLRYQAKRFSAMMESPGYFNSSLIDTISGEYWRSFAKKRDYFHIFDYWRWDEKEINKVLIDEYDWETAPDTSTTWRIGDGTAGFYNYVYFTIAGLTEHDTLRSNQIREGQISRTEALSLVADENQPRYESIKWYLDCLGFEFADVIKTINAAKRLF